MPNTLKVKDKEILLDSSQIKVYKILKSLKAEVDHPQNSQSLFSLFKAIFFPKKQSLSLGLYIYGRVGRGKSMLMNDFYKSIENADKTYYHFNEFMQNIHKELFKLRKESDANSDNLIELVTKRIVGNSKIICLDEFQVDDVTDALILRRIFSYIFSKAIVVIFTSNSKPENLYQDGLQRDLFLKFINDVLKKNCQIANLDSETDYREKFLHKIKKHHYYPVNEKNKKDLLNIFYHLTHKNEYYKEELEVLGRKVVISKAYENIAIFNFSELCEDDKGVADYQAICSKYEVIILLNVPKLAKEDRNEAKRFILFIDELYEKKRTLLMLSQTKIEEIYESGTDSKKFKRTVSRLREIMSDSYGRPLNVKK